MSQRNPSRAGLSPRSIAAAAVLAARSKKIAGTVLVRGSIAADTTVSDATIMQVSPSSAAALTDGLVEAIRQWRLNPLTR